MFWISLAKKLQECSFRTIIHAKMLKMEKLNPLEEREFVMNEMAGLIVESMMKMDIYEKFKYLERLHIRLDGKAERVFKRTFNVAYGKQYAEVYQAIILFMHHNNYDKIEQKNDGQES